MSSPSGSPEVKVPILNDLGSWIFVSNPKAASTSVEAVLATSQDRPDLDELHAPGYFTRRHAPAAVLHDSLGASAWSQLYSFAIIRDPHDWFVSQAIYNQSRIGHLDTSSPLNSEDVLKSDRSLSFARGQDASPTATQWAFVCDANGTVLTTELWRLDNLRKTWRAICRQLNVPYSPLPRLNSSSRPSTEALALTRRAPHNIPAV